MTDLTPEEALAEIETVMGDLFHGCVDLYHAKPRVRAILARTQPAESVLREAAQAVSDWFATAPLGWMETPQWVVDKADAVRDRLNDALATPAPALDAAWQEAEAALPEGWVVDGVRRIYRDGRVVSGKQAWVARATRPRTAEAIPLGAEYGPTPAAALRALARILRDRQPAADAGGPEG